MAHVITLQMSKNRIPRWLSEGTSVFEERRAPAGVGQGDRHRLRAGLERRQDAEARRYQRRVQRSADDYDCVLRIVAGCGASDRHLRRAEVPRFIRSYGRGLETKQALKEVYGASVEADPEVVRRADREELQRVRRALKRPDVEGSRDDRRVESAGDGEPREFRRSDAAGVEARGRRRQRRRPLHAAERAAKLLPTASGDNNPHRVIADDRAEGRRQAARGPRAGRRAQDRSQRRRSRHGRSSRWSSRWATPPAPRPRTARRGRRSVRREGGGCAGTPGAEAERYGDRGPLVQERAGHQSRQTARRRIPIWPKHSLRRVSSRKPRPQTLNALGTCAELRPRPDLLLKINEAGGG